MHREKQGFGDQVKSKVGEDGDEHGGPHKQAQRHSNNSRQVFQQKIAEAVYEPFKALHTRGRRDMTGILDLLYCHRVFPYIWKALARSLNSMRPSKGVLPLMMITGIR